MGGELGGDDGAGGGGVGGGGDTMGEEPTVTQAQLGARMAAVDDTLRASAELKVRHNELTSERRAARAICMVIEGVHARYRSYTSYICILHMHTSSTRAGER